MIPQEKQEAVVRALREAFGAAEYDDIAQITKGNTSSLVYRIVVQGAPYLLKIIMRQEDPSRHYACMKAAAEGGVAPHVVYTSVPDQVSITEFVEGEALSIEEARGRMPVVLRTLHALPPFAKAPFNTTCTFLLNQGPMVDGFLQKFQGAKILPSADGEEFSARLAEVTSVYPRDADLVSSHNDLFKPDNILYRGGRVRLVDWEAAFLNDRYADLAAVANQVVRNELEEAAFLEAYFGAPPDAYQRARFHLMQQLSHLFYTMAFLHLGAMDNPVDWSQPVPGFEEFQRRFWTGEVDLTSKEMKVAYGRVHWERLRRSVRQPRYQESLRIVRDGRAAAG